MDNDTQQLIALALVALVVAFALWRRARNRRSNKPGCSGCDTPGDSAAGERGANEKPLRFYRRK